MELLALRVRVTEDDAARLLTKVPPDELPVKELTVRFTSEGVVAEGKYPTLMLAVPFKMVWRLDVSEGKVRAHLASIDFYGVPAGPFRGMILNMVQEEAERLEGVTRNGETILVDLAAAAAGLGFPVKLTPREIQHEAGAVVFVAGE